MKGTSFSTIFKLTFYLKKQFLFQNKVKYIFSPNFIPLKMSSPPATSSNHEEKQNTFHLIYFPNTHSYQVVNLL